jgi:ParB-like chromosome segregation protein Spo0J
MAIVEIERLGFGYQEVAQFDLNDLDPQRRVQVRDSSHYAPKDEVERYAVQMEHSQFPPIIVTSDGWIVDGNTRVGASLARKQKFFPAIVVDASAAGSVKERNQLTALASTLNNLNGRPLTRKEARTAAESMIALGWKTEQIGRALGVKPSVITQVRKEIDAVDKLNRVGLKANGGESGVRSASLRALGSRDALNLNDVPFKELATLARDAGLNAGEVVGMAKEMKAAGSDQGALEKIQSVRVEMGDRIAEQTLTGRAKPPVARQLRQHLGNVVKYEGRESELVETDPKVGPLHLEMIERSIKVLTVLLEAQR